MTLTMVAEVAGDGSWYGIVENSDTEGRWVEVHAAPTVSVAANIAPAAGWVPGNGTLKIGFLYSLALLRMVAFEDGADPPNGVVPLSTPFPRHAGFRLRSGEDEVTVTTGFPDVY